MFSIVLTILILLECLRQRYHHMIQLTCVEDYILYSKPRSNVLSVQVHDIGIICWE